MHACAQIAEKEEWWEASAELPLQAVCMDFVINYHEHYDNNGRKDYAIKVRFLPLCSSSDVP
jgi:hypothetical protein